MKRSGPMTGVVTLVMIFAVLCMSVFTVLSVSSAEQDWALAKLTAKQAENYYRADCNAAEKAAALLEGARDLDGVALTETEEGTLAEYAEPVGESQTLEAAVLLGTDGLRIVKWRTVYSGEWEPKNGFTLWDGE